MNLLLKKIPLPIAGLMLALATLGNVLGGFHPALKTLCGSISVILAVLLLIKCILFKDALKTGLEHPIVSGVLCTYPMGLMVLSVYLKPISASGAFYLWSFAILLHLILLGLFTKRFLMNIDLAKVFPSYFIVYVGFVVASVTAPAHNMKALGQILFWIGLINFLWLLPIVLKRLAKLGIPMPPAKPTLVILSAPSSLCLAGYMSSFDQKIFSFVATLLCVSSLLYIYVLTQLPKLLALPFFPSYSAFTFPLVISAVAFKKASVFIIKTTGEYSFLSLWANFAIGVASVITFYVLIRYISAMLTAPKSVPEKA